MPIQGSKGVNGAGYVDPTVNSALKNMAETARTEYIARHQKRSPSVVRYGDETPAASFGKYIASHEVRHTSAPSIPDADVLKQARKVYSLCAQIMALLGIKIEDCTLRLKGGYIMTRDEIIPKEDK